MVAGKWQKTFTMLLPVFTLGRFRRTIGGRKRRRRRRRGRRRKKQIEGGTDFPDSRILPRFPGNDTDRTVHWEELLRADSARVRRGKKVR